MTVVVLEIVFWLCILAILHSYLFYPIILRLLAIGKKPNAIVYDQDEDFPFVSIIMSVYNEESVIEQKLESLLALDYPTDKWRILIGSDCSSDKTNEIVSRRAEIEERLHFYPFQQRRGKPGVINELAAKAMELEAEGPDHIFLITDANVMLTPPVLRQLTKHFKNEEIAVVDAHMIHTGMKKEGISKVENQYISTEVRIKYLEGVLWKKMIGPFGGCYSIRSNYYTDVPSNFLVDDFYITMRAFEKGGGAINELEAVCFEGVSHEIKEEYRRKSRISAGNYQNLLTFPHLWWPPFRTLNFAFFSHKVLRWFGPFFLIILLLTGALLALLGSSLYLFLFVVLVIGLLLLPMLDFLFQRFAFNVLIFRATRYFLLMNLALLEGYFKFRKGIKTNAWEPPKRV